MERTIEQLAELFSRDLNRLEREVERLKEEHVWEVPEGVTNSCGVLVQHIAGNLNHFVGAALGNTSYERDRKREFTDTGIDLEELLGQVESCRKTVEKVLGELEPSMLDEPYPLKIPMDYSVRQFLMHLYGHLNYHLGQLNYLRRILEGKEA